MPAHGCDRDGTTRGGERHESHRSRSFPGKSLLGRCSPLPRSAAARLQPDARPRRRRPRPRAGSRRSRDHDRPAARAQRLRPEEALSAAAGVPLGRHRAPGRLQAPRQLPGDLHRDPRAPRRGGLLRQHERRDRAAQGGGRDPGAARRAQRRLDVHRRHLHQARQRHHEGPADLEGQARRAREQGDDRRVPLPAEPAAALRVPGRPRGLLQADDLHRQPRRRDPRRLQRRIRLRRLQEHRLRGVHQAPPRDPAQPDRVRDVGAGALERPRRPARPRPGAQAPAARGADRDEHQRGRAARAAPVPGATLRRDGRAPTTSRCSRWPRRPGSTSPPGRCGKFTRAAPP